MLRFAAAPASDSRQCEQGDRTGCGGDLRREVNAAEGSFPEEAGDPIFIEITSSNAFPAATMALVGSGDDETNAVGKTVQMTAKNSSKTDAEGNSTQMTTPKSSRMDPDGKTTQMIATNSLSASASTAQILATN